MVRIVLGTSDGLVAFEGEPGRWSESYRAAGGEDLITLRFFPGDPDGLLAGSYGNGLFRVSEAGRKVEKVALGEDYVRTLAFAGDDPATVYAGTEPAEIYRSQDRGETWSSLHVRDLPEASGWRLPYSPRAGALRSLVLPQPDPFVIYAGVEQGGFLSSHDHGATWRLVEGPVDKDIHALAVDPGRMRRIFAATGEGVFRSPDGGGEWERLSEDYTRGIALLPGEPGVVFAGPAADVGEGGWIVISRDGGNSWERCMSGLPDALDDMVQLFVCSPELPEVIFAVRSGGSLWSARIDRLEWEPVFAEVKGIQTLALCALRE